jgi:pyruvyltransferase
MAKILLIVLTWILCFPHFLFSSSVDTEIPLFYWDARPNLGFSNFGDALSVSIVEKIVGKSITTATTPAPGSKKLLAVGSIVNYAREGDVLWGTGVNGKYQKRADYPFNTLDVRAVRGPLSRQFLMEMGIECPEVYGDPTLLLPKLFPEFQKSSSPSRDYIVIPHFSDEELFRHLPHMVSVKEDWRVVVAKILDSQFVISSALSGIIVAEAFGIPARLVISPNENNTETIFKYSDYYYGTGRFNYRFATSIEEALEMGGEPLPECDLERLLQTFPYGLYFGNNR